MAESGMINIKAFLNTDDSNVEARRFTVDASVATSFLFMKEKLRAVFPILHDAFFKITWRDVDGDEITIASDEDFIIAFTEMNTNIKVFYATLSHDNQEPVYTSCPINQNAQLQVICDICNQIITGMRYKCMQCPNYDLCATCEHQGHHSDHIMLRLSIDDSTYVPKCTRKFMHQIARNLKRSACAASKEAHRATKAASKCATSKSSTSQANEHCQTNQESRCPFNNGAPINMEEIHALGAMARQHFGPLLTTFQAESTDNQQGGIVMDIIRNAVNGFFGASTESESPQQNETKETEKVSDKVSKDSIPMDTEVTAENNQPSAPIFNTPAAPQASDQVSIQSNTDVSESASKGQNQEKEWTFVATNKNNANEGVQHSNMQSNQQMPPVAFFYHPNPVIAEGLAKLYEMGFSNENGFLTHLLERHQGNVPAVIKTIVETNL